MKTVNTYMVPMTAAPMGYAGMPAAADYDCSMEGTGMHKLDLI